ncbi:TIGR01777 family oxidoreductase [Microbacterium sp. C7(2022)]|uniref:TIGR01777 family oxidoreductase n=1 Tax=Microbacterium sp. C7(2022) TaxID=2992759 RepID=UPI00237A6314|nr:TIGR01777 family oxidoreductase [Microbacterium sp. C7(2022)]MDE0547152.1 TIGR01777 family oxidoreductase [Microbacterium sp. C7(2022)]
MPESRVRRVVVAGSSGLIGRALVDSLAADGVEVTTLVRRPPVRPGEVEWLTDSDALDPAVIEGADAVVGLNGASIGKLPWTANYRHTLLWSRVTPTRVIAHAMRALGDGAPHFVSASAVGFYGDAPGVVLTEESPRGDTFLADLCGEWETAALSAGDAARVSLLRTAPIVHREGVLAPLLVLTRWGLGGPLGRGTQSWPWISLEDEVRAIRHVLEHRIAGPVNLVGPTRATANDLGFAVAMRMNRPYVVRAPEFALRLALGRDAVDSLLTSDAYVVPTALEPSGFTFRHRHVTDAVAAAVPASGTAA